MSEAVSPAEPSELSYGEAGYYRLLHMLDYKNIQLEGADLAIVYSL